MTLTNDDLAAIKNIVDVAVEDSKLQTAAGFNEVHEKFAEVHEQFARVNEQFVEVNKQFVEVHKKIDGINHGLSQKLDTVQTTVDRIERIQRAEVERVDIHEKDIKLIKRTLSVA